MALINELKGIGDAIREKTGETELIPLKEMADAILSISGGESVGYSSITYNEDDTVTLTQTNGAIRTMTCEYDGDKLVGLKYGNEVIPLTYEDDVLVGIGGMEVDMGNAPSDTRLKEIIEGTLTELVDDTITTVRNYGFYYSTVQNVDLPNCTSVGQRGFSECSKLVSANLPNCESIGIAGFASSDALVSVNLQNCKTINAQSFINCEKLTSANLPNCESVLDYGFSGCSALASVVLPNCKKLGAEAFKSCAKLTSIVLPNCTTVGETVFSGCTTLERVDLGSATKINKQAFYNCKALTTLIIRTNQVASVTITYLFQSTPIANGTGYIYVPDDLVEDYKVATGWSNWADQIKGLSELEVVSNE